MESIGRSLPPILVQDIPIVVPEAPIEPAHPPIGFKTDPNHSAFFAPLIHRSPSPSDVSYPQSEHVQTADALTRG